MRQVHRSAHAETIIELSIERLIKTQDPITIYVCVESVVYVKEIGFAVKVFAAGFDREVNYTP